VRRRAVRRVREQREALPLSDICLRLRRIQRQICRCCAKIAALARASALAAVLRRYAMPIAARDAAMSATEVRGIDMLLIR